MTQTFTPHQANPVERAITGAPSADAASVSQSLFDPLGVGLPFAGEGDE